MERSTKRRLRVFAAAGASICFAILFVESWMRETNHRTYIGTFIWGVGMFLILFSIVLHIRDKE
jgi:predicted membrane channel-forming protein YqfA (hemolysin III family)